MQLGNSLVTHHLPAFIMRAQTAVLQVTATNAAGLTTSVNGLPITVDKSL
jgi:hypothetical protein